MLIQLGFAGLLLGQLNALQGGLLAMLRPQLEAQMTRECEKAVATPDGPFLNLQSICREIAQPASVCLVEEIQRQGKLTQVAAEALSGRLGSASLNVASACIERLMQSAQPVWDQEFPLRP